MFGLLLHSQLAHAQEIYKWVDEKGTVHLTDDPSTIKLSVQPENAATRKSDELARQRILKEATPNLKLPQKSYYDANPEERYLDQVHEMNKELMKIKKSQRGSPPPMSLSPPPCMYNQAKNAYQLCYHVTADGKCVHYGEACGQVGHNEQKVHTNPGAIDVRTGEFYPGVAGGIINPRTGEFMPDVGGGFIDPKSGRFIPKN
jgi:hypothetical protein